MKCGCLLNDICQNLRNIGKKAGGTGFHTKSGPKVKIGNNHNIAALAEETKLPGEKKIEPENLIPF